MTAALKTSAAVVSSAIIRLGEEFDVSRAHLFLVLFHCFLRIDERFKIGVGFSGMPTIVIVEDNAVQYLQRSEKLFDFAFPAVIRKALGFKGN